MKFLITGGASGLGNAITCAIAKTYPGSKVYFTYHSSIENAKELERQFGNTNGMQCDFTSESNISELCDFIRDTGIDILVNNAITGLNKQYFHKTSESYFIDCFAHDILPVLRITQAFILQAREARFGKIITILSAALNSTPPIGWSVYLANKAYLLSMHKSWATENKDFNITSNCVSPGFMVTPLHGDLDERIIEDMVNNHPFKQLLTVEDTAQVVLSLCNPELMQNDQHIIIDSSQNIK